MISIISPAKTFNEKPQAYASETSQPDFLEDSQKLVNKLKNQSLRNLESLMTIEIKSAVLEQPYGNLSGCCWVFQGFVQKSQLKVKNESKRD